jgi:hypothetical protein
MNEKKIGDGAMSNVFQYDPKPETFQEIAKKNGDEFMNFNHQPIALKKMNPDGIKGLISHHTVSEVMMLKKFNHKNVCTLNNVHYNHHLNDLSCFKKEK